MKEPLSSGKNKIHIYFFALLSINYLFPIIIFGEITTFYYDNLDIMLPNNKIVGKYMLGDKEGLSYFLNGNLKIEYFKEWLKPYILLYSFNPEIGFLINEIFIKITAYITFFILSKKLNKNLFYCSLASAFYASTQNEIIGGYGPAFAPYLIYLIAFKKNFKFKNYFFIFLFGLNCDLVRNLFIGPVIFFITWILNGNINKYILKKTLIINFVFYFAMFLTNFHLIFLVFSETIFHRVEFSLTENSYKEIFLSFVKDLTKITNDKSWVFFFNLPYVIIQFPILFLSLKQNNLVIKKIALFFILITATIYFLQLPIIVDIKKIFPSFLGSYRFSNIQVFFSLIISLLIILNLKLSFNLNKIFVFLSLLSIFIFQINSSMVPLIKKASNKEFRNFYTFSEYYLYDDYKKIKAIIKDKRVMSIGLDPLVAVVNNIKTIDGYHTIYPLEYKKKFRNIIVDELNNNLTIKNYYDYWGSRVYVFYNDQENIKINFKEAKKIGAEYVISKFKLYNNGLSLICENCSNYFFLYKIN